MVTLEQIGRTGANEYSEYSIWAFYVNGKQVPRKFFYKVSTYYFNKYLEGFYSQEAKQTSRYLQIKYYSKKI